jgi:hypothetical protein
MHNFQAKDHTEGGPHGDGSHADEARHASRSRLAHCGRFVIEPPCGRLSTATGTVPIPALPVVGFAR